MPRVSFCKLPYFLETGLLYGRRVVAFESFFMECPQNTVRSLTAETGTFRISECVLTAG